jgi:hypothetical protein
MPVLDRADAVRPIPEEAVGLPGLVQIFHELVAERLQEATKLRRLEPGAVRLAHGQGTARCQSDVGLCKQMLRVTFGGIIA